MLPRPTRLDIGENIIEPDVFQVQRPILRFRVEGFGFCEGSRTEQTALQDERDTAKTKQPLELGDVKANSAQEVSQVLSQAAPQLKRGKACIAR